MVISMPRPARPLDFGLVALEDVEDAAADGADAQQADLDRFHLFSSVCLRSSGGRTSVTSVGRSHGPPAVTPRHRPVVPSGVHEARAVPHPCSWRSSRPARGPLHAMMRLVCG